MSLCESFSRAGARPICPLQTCSWRLLGSGCYGIDRGLVDALLQMSAHLPPGPPEAGE